MEPGADVRAGDVLARIPTSSARSGDITGGLPRVAELFEARRPKDHAIIAEISGTIEFGKDYKNKQRITIKPDDANAEPVEYLIPRGKSLAVQHGDRIERGDFVYDGHPAPHDILAIKGVEELANYLINEIQDVYRLQGVTINDKHIEVIVRQMLQKVEVTDPGDTDLIKSEQLDRVELDEINAAITAAGKKPAAASPVLLGITKASLQTRSFISAASFQETTRVLTDAAVNGKVDTLEGLKENVIVGRLIPAGTGGALRRLRKIAAKRDELIAREQAKVDAEKALAGPGCRAGASSSAHGGRGRRIRALLQERGRNSRPRFFSWHAAMRSAPGPRSASASRPKKCRHGWLAGVDRILLSVYRSAHSHGRW